MAVRTCRSAVAARDARRVRSLRAASPLRRLTRSSFPQVLLQTSQGDVVIDLHVELAPKACKNFLKLCKCVRRRRAGVRGRSRAGRRRLKYYNNNIFFNVQKDFIIQAGDPTNTGKGGDSLNKCAAAPRVSARLLRRCDLCARARAPNALASLRAPRSASDSVASRRAGCCTASRRGTLRTRSLRS